MTILQFPEKTLLYNCTEAASWKMRTRLPHEKEPDSYEHSLAISNMCHFIRQNYKNKFKMTQLSEAPFTLTVNWLHAGVPTSLGAKITVCTPNGHHMLLISIKRTLLCPITKCCPLRVVFPIKFQKQACSVTEILT